MRLRGYVTTMLVVSSLAPLAMAQSNLDAATNEQYQPRLGDIMNAVQLRHMKLWFAGKALNWELAAYELRQIMAGLSEAASLYPGIPVSNITTMANPVRSIADAIEAKDIGRFTRAFVEMTDGCNACHKSTGRAFIVMRTPWEQPFSNQVFPPQAKQ
jgi:hypothetical protein